MSNPRWKDFAEAFKDPSLGSREQRILEEHYAPVAAWIRETRELYAALARSNARALAYLEQRRVERGRT